MVIWNAVCGARSEGDLTLFHVPEIYRVKYGPMGSDASYGNNGAFLIPSPMSAKHAFRRLVIIASDGLGWEHVSVHAEQDGKTRTPHWDEMCFIKDVFWDGEDVVMQLHPRRSTYVNVHPNSLHLWRPLQAEIPTPPLKLV